MARHTTASGGRGVGGEGHGGRDAYVEGGNVLAPNPKKRRVRIPSIVERGRRQKKKKGKAVSTEDLPFWQNRQKLAKKKSGKIGKAVTIGFRGFYV
jgi:hypothetical protein